MAHGYSDGKYRGGSSDRSKTNNGPGKNAQKQGENKQKSENHSQKGKRPPPLMTPLSKPRKW